MLLEKLFMCIMQDWGLTGGLLDIPSHVHAIGMEKNIESFFHSGKTAMHGRRTVHAYAGTFPTLLSNPSGSKHLTSCLLTRSPFLVNSKDG